MSKKALILGISANIGSAVGEELLCRGYDITGYSRSKPTHTGLKDVRWIQGDRADRNSFKKLLRVSKYDVVIDMAAFKHEDVEYAFETFRDCGHYVVASSAAVYGIVPLNLQPIREDIPLNPVSEYGKNKVAVEKFCTGMHRIYNWPVTIIRPNHTYGRLNSVFRHINQENYWLDRILKGKPIIVGNGQIYRSFTHVEDTARMVAGILEHPEKTIGQVYNTTNMYANTWAEWHAGVMQALGKKTQLVELTCDFLKPYNPPGYFSFSTSWQYNSICCTKKLRSDIEFTQQITLEEGLKKQIEYVLQRDLIPNCEESLWEDVVIADYRKTLTK